MTGSAGRRELHDAWMARGVDWLVMSEDLPHVENRVIVESGATVEQRAFRDRGRAAGKQRVNLLSNLPGRGRKRRCAFPEVAVAAQESGFRKHLRRAIEQTNYESLAKLTCDEFMTRKPVVVTPQLLAFDALRLMEDRPSQISVEDPANRSQTVTSPSTQRGWAWRQTPTPHSMLPTSMLAFTQISAVGSQASEVQMLSSVQTGVVPG